MHRLSTVIDTAAPPFASALALAPVPKAEYPRPCLAPTGVQVAPCADQGRTQHRNAESLPGVAPAFPLAAVQPIHATPLFRLCNGGH
jgi:hypothetical protein